MRPLPVQNCSRVIERARALIADPERAAQQPAFIRTMAWRILVNARSRPAIREPRRASHLPEGA
ncbi:hypothetical protein [Paracoccus denitrificans]|jgi:hypothetical protein|uniref:hypothetical protein n=1 Tax=Paracoccus denitrificans TaxID=266 RepID=UPI0005A048A4|nr:hypothetical protein [Paracoccus denitrificans]MBB4630298.1 hypothetical protein [Paracoccus denitrificans]MCU7431662.1 hypothetical protein [Paracoccus denitrificans]QAR27115.1 hypothetical protein EO213_12825 [Paracoccus denitrificans]UPV96079.1 hypothetical protein M0K93_05690 [Paracoccus denitrificans]WQO34558.1 hypothetical protein U0005_05745 [Paracoccus denitrificans]